MAQDINGQLEQAVLSSIKQGRWLAEEWEEVGIYPGKRLQALLPQLLQRLKGGEPLAFNDEDALDLMAEEIVDALNAESQAFSKEINRVSNMKFTPKIQFVKDESFEEAQRIDDILRSVHIPGDDE